MGQVKENLLTKGFSGRIGDEIVFRQVNGRTVFGKRPKKKETITPKQVTHQARFQKAVLYARTALVHSATREDYEQAAQKAGLKSAYLAAVTDFLLEPKIVEVYTTGYKGNVGDAIVFLVADDFKIVEAVVTIKRADDTILETGPATLSGHGWLYLVQQPNANLAGCNVIITVKDRLKKTAVQESMVTVV